VRNTSFVFAMATSAILTACSSASAPAPPLSASYAPMHVPSQLLYRGTAFPDSPRVTNPYLPYVPGTKYIYQGTVGSQPEKDVQLVTRHTRVIDGIPCVTVVDYGYVSGVLEERTDDYYAQDFSGNVWYFGEYETAYHPFGHKSSWLAGVNGASAGIVMEGAPRVGDVYHQENAPKIAEDQARIVSLTTSVNTPFGEFFGNVLETLEYSPLEPGVLEHKFYEPGYGLMKAHVFKGGAETLELTGIVKF
jgi:hypothetical protein